MMHYHNNYNPTVVVVNISMIFTGGKKKNGSLDYSTAKTKLWGYETEVVS